METLLRQTSFVECAVRKVQATPPRSESLELAVGHPKKGLAREGLWRVGGFRRWRSYLTIAGLVPEVERGAFGESVPPGKESILNGSKGPPTGNDPAPVDMSGGS